MTPVYAMVKDVKGEFDQVVEKVREELKAEGFGVLMEIDVQKTLKQKLGVDYDRYLILGACNPPNAYKALQAEVEVGLLLPCNVVVYEKEGRVFVGVVRPTKVLVLSGNDKLKAIAEEVEERLVRVLNQV